MGNPVTSLAARLALSTEATIARRLVLGRHAAVATAIWPRATVTSVGSFAQNTSLNGSDLDVVVDIPDQIYHREAAGKWATMLRKELIAQRVTRDQTSTILSNARVPILTYVDLKDEVGVDVSFLPNSIVNTEYVRRELESRPYMRTMLILLKYWLKNRNMNKVYTGGLGSYALACSVIGYFNVRKHVKARKATRDQYDQWLIDQDIYWLLVDYLTFWASQWKYAKDMLEPGEGVIYKKGSKGHCGGNRNKLLAIADPTDPTNNVTGGTTKITDLRRAMKLLKDKLLLAGPGITQVALLGLLENTGKKFKDGKGAFGKKASSKKGARVGSAKAPKKAVPGGTRRPLPPQGVPSPPRGVPPPPRGGVLFRSILLKTVI